MSDQTLFCGDSCHSGRCICRTLTVAVLTERLVSDAANGIHERRRVAELVGEAMRLFGVADTVLTPHASAEGHAQSVGSLCSPPAYSGNSRADSGVAGESARDECGAHAQGA